VRIAFLGSKGIPGRHGVEVVVEEVAVRLAAMGHAVTVFGYEGYVEGRSSWRGCGIRAVRTSRRALLEMPSAVRAAVRQVLREGPGAWDAVHIHSADPCLFAGPLYGKLPVAATSHGRGYRRTSIGPLRTTFSRLAERVFLSRPDALSCVSPTDTEHYNRRRPGAGVAYIPNGMPAPREGRAEDLAEWGLRPGGYVLFSAGRILPSKGLHVLLEAWRLLGATVPLVVVGGASGDGRYYREQVAGSPAGVVFTGFIADRRLWSLYRFPAAAVFPSEAEAQSMTLLEFLGTGLEVVYSDIPENSAVAAGLGRPFRSGSPESLAEALGGLLNGDAPPRRDPAAVERLVREHDWDRIAEAYVGLYERAIACRRSRTSRGGC